MAVVVSIKLSKQRPFDGTLRLLKFDTDFKTAPGEFGHKRILLNNVILTFE